MRLDEVIRSLSAMLGRGKTAFVLVLLTVNWIVIPEYQAHAQTASEVELHARGGAVLQVVPLHAGEEGLLVDRYYGDWRPNSNDDLGGVLYLQWSQVDSIIIPAKIEAAQYVLALITGFLWSVPATIVGGLIGEKVCGTGREDMDCVVTTAVSIGAAGFIAGAIYNWPDAEKYADKICHPSNQNDREMLRKLCVYPDTLPAALRDLLPKEDVK
ncbi:MAG: hypothetical protein WBQ23_14055 [Bacteroidota bacterium]